MQKSHFPYRYIAIEGNIGAGKTTLCTQLGMHFGWEVHYESTDNNPYLSDFYNDMKRWSFNLQVYFLNNRYRQILEILKGGITVVQDRTIYEDAHIFAKNLRENGVLSERDYQNYWGIFDSMKSMSTPPDLLIYLRASVPTLIKQISRRGRDYEQSISIKYLETLNRQ